MRNKKGDKKRFIDNEEVKTRLAELHLLHLDDLKSKLEAGLIEAQEGRLIWDMVKAHGIGIDGVEELAEKALKQAERNIEDLGIDDNWSFKE